jgi:hypothetical protein
MVRRMIPLSCAIKNGSRLLMIVMLCWVGVCVKEGRAAEEIPAGTAEAIDESVAVHSGMSADSPIVVSLKKGETVTIEYEMEGPEGAWCGVTVVTRPDISGYVPCQHLKRAETRERRWERVGSAGEPGGDTTRVTVEENQVLVPVTLAYKGTTTTALLLLDTGASISVISTDVADRLGIKPTDTKIGIGQVVGGGLIVLFLAKMDYLTAGPYTKDEIEIGVVAQRGPAVKFDGLLGMDFLRDLKYTIDSRNHLIRWESGP